MKAIIPISPNRLGGEVITVTCDCFKVLASREKTVLIEFHSVPEEIHWFENFELLYCQRQHDPETIKVIRTATEAERIDFRVPLWIEAEEIPECCGRKMEFVGQIDDDVICTERPADAKMWWRHRASFYVFTCSQCLQCKAVGQQV